MGKRCEDAGEISRFLEGGTRGHFHADVHFVGDDEGKRCFAETRRSREQHVVERFASLPGGSDEHLQVLNDLLLANELLKPRGAEGAVEFDVVLETLRIGDVGFAHTVQR